VVLIRITAVDGSDLTVDIVVMLTDGYFCSRIINGEMGVVGWVRGDGIPFFSERNLLLMYSILWFSFTATCLSLILCVPLLLLLGLHPDYKYGIHYILHCHKLMCNVR